MKCHPRTAVAPIDDPERLAIGSRVGPQQFDQAFAHRTDTAAHVAAGHRRTQQVLLGTVDMHHAFAEQGIAAIAADQFGEALAQ